MLAWVTAPTPSGRQRANNTIRQRLSTVATFTDWLRGNGRIDFDPLPRHVRRQITQAYPKTYGKAQDTHKARWLTYDQAYGQLLPACEDGTWTGVRDELFCRLGLSGLRLSEILDLTVGEYQDGTITHTGKKNRVRTVEPGPSLTALLARWLNEYSARLGRSLRPTDPLICTRTKRNETTWNADATAFDHQIAWGRRLSKPCAQRLLVHRAALAGLGHIAPHDLRRSAAGILHHARGTDGGHLYDLMDIAHVLDHADTATTQRSYIDVLDKQDVKRRAGHTLD